MSVPLPAILVAIVIAPDLPAWEIISASLSWNLAFKTLWGMFADFKREENFSDLSMLVVPIKTGCLWAKQFFTFSKIAFSFSFKEMYILSALSFLRSFLLVGMLITSKL
jgi:hypothetical protein